MSPYRIAGGVAAGMLALMLLVVTVVWITYTGNVLPSVAVVTQSSVNQSSPTPNSPPGSLAERKGVPAATLAARARLQADEVNAAPSPGEESLRFQPGVRNGDDLLQRWRETADRNQQATPSQEIVGLSSLPYRNAEVLEQPQGRDWRAQHNGLVRFGGGWLIFGVGFALALFLFARGRIAIAEGRTDETVPRFDALERANHWMTASSFLLMALTGLVILYGKPLLLGLIGEPALGRLAWWSAWLHIGAAVPFVIGVAVMVLLWLRENLITRLDVEWLRRFGGFLHDDPDKPSARRFNAGQKLVFWGVVTGGVAALSTGIMLMLPFSLLGYDGMQWAQLLHAGVGVAMIALIVGHIYIGTVGMEGAIDAMWSGRVDSNWAREHHDLWYEDIAGRTDQSQRSRHAGE